MSDDLPIIEIRPSWWNYFWLLAFSWLVIPYFIAWLKRSSTVMRVYDERLTMETGVLAKRLVEIYIADIRAVEIEQSLWQRIVNIGDLRIDTAGASDDELSALGIPRPRAVYDRIQKLRKALQEHNKAREESHRD